jgi:hypothetical protein
MQSEVQGNKTLSHAIREFKVFKARICPEFFRYLAVYVENFAKFVPIWPEFWLSTLTFFLTKGPVLRFTIS